MGQAGSLEENDTTSLENVEFYTNKIPSRPAPCGLIDDIHQRWLGDWDLLEEHHGYVQWFFPIREGGMNSEAQPLSKNEAQIFRTTPEIKPRIIQSYKIMLDFYGLVLLDEQTGEIARNPATYKQRYAHLNSSFHNYLRITRIMKFLGIMGMENFKLPFLRHFVLEIFKNRLVTRASDSLVRFWLPTLRRPEELALLDNLCGSLGRTVDRDGRDGRGDEHGKDNWATELIQCDALVDVNNLPAYLTGALLSNVINVIADDVKTADADPFADKR